MTELIVLDAHPTMRSVTITTTTIAEITCLICAAISVNRALSRHETEQGVNDDGADQTEAEQLGERVGA